ncbi:MAG: radical SAM protein [Dehalococcoidales bacterium]|nr:radical SAM protein [Dehalococcoidales bacterium]
MSENQYPLFIDWAITGKCNLNCRHCRGFSEEELSTERAAALAAEIIELKPGWVIIEGGEPLLRGDLFEMLEILRQSQLEVNLITNGMLLDLQKIDNLKQLGVRVMISIDGATSATYEAIRTGASFNKVVQAARNCAREGLLEAINFTLLKKNYTEIPEIFALAVSIEVNKVNIIGLKPCQEYADELLSPYEYGKAIRLACHASEKTGVGLFFDEPFFQAVAKEEGLPVTKLAKSGGILAPSTSACIFGEYLFIETNGDVKPCSFASMVLGNVNQKALGDIWGDILSSSDLSRIGDPKTRTGACRNCSYLVDCKGCRSRTYVLTGNWFASDPVCPLKLKAADK